MGYSIILKGQHFLLLPEKALFWEEQQMLIIADAHFGKVDHFRKAGVPVPNGAASHSLNLLYQLSSQYQPESVLFLGDLFHSSHNKDWDAFIEWRNFYNKNVILTEGNHDILTERHYQKANLSLMPFLDFPPFLFAHIPNSKYNTSHYAFFGHIHPAVRLIGKARQEFRLPCFLVRENYAVLPAFGAFTGNALQKPIDSDQVFVINGNEVIKIEGR